MAKKKNTTENNFYPFTHKELELKNALVDEARQSRYKDKFSERLSSAMIYVGITEYLAEHLLENLRYITYRITYIDCAGIVYIDARDRDKNRPLGITFELLERYVFPDKSSILETLRNIKDSRNRLFHNLAKTSLDEFSQLDKEIKSIQDDAERFIEQINVVYAGLQKIFLPNSETNQKNEQS